MEMFMGDYAGFPPMTGPPVDSSTFANTNINSGMSLDIKPRLTKEQQTILEAHYQKQNKPNTANKTAFADSLGVTLEKVNNWFQNRRAKTKHDARQAAEKAAQKQQDDGNPTRPPRDGGPADWSSDADISPALASADYASMMPFYDLDKPATHATLNSNIGLPQQMHQDPVFANFDHATHFHLPQAPPNFFDHSQELNRRTITQAQVDAYLQSNDLMQCNPAHNLYQPGISDDFGLASHTPMALTDITRQHAFNACPNTAGTSTSSHGSTDPSNLSEQSFPSTSHIQERASMSTNGSDWNDSRCSSVTGMQLDDAATHMLTGPSNSQWQPGQSIPVDSNALYEHFQQVAQQAQGRIGHVHEQPLMQTYEEPLAFPADEAFTRRESQASMLAQNMSHVAIQAPQTLSHGERSFKVPAPPASHATIAARRQRPRPAALGPAALRSQSCSGATQLNSPGHPPQTGMGSNQSLRRIRSSNVVGIAQGRIQKMPGSAQRSPMGFTFAESLNSPKAFRHASQSAAGTLAPPTPLTPHESPLPDPSRAINFWQTSSGHASRQPSITEHELEHAGAFMPQPSALPHQNVCSPPQTPMYYSQTSGQQRMTSDFHLENTPPQSAPASQLCFQNNYLPPHMAQSQAALQQQMMPYGPGHAQQAMSIAGPEQYMPVPNPGFGSVQNFAAPTMFPTSDLPRQYHQGVPTVTADNQLRMVMPPPLQQPQLMQFSAGSHISLPTEPYYSLISTLNSSPNNSTAKPTAAEFEIHQYTPSDAIKSAAGPHRAVDTGPMNYTFAIQRPEDFGKAKKSNDSKSSANSSISPPRSTGVDVGC